MLTSRSFAEIAHHVRLDNGGKYFAFWDALCNSHAEIPGARADIGDKRRALTTIDGGGNRSAAFGEDKRSACERGRLLMKQASGVDNDRLASHGLGAAHSDHHVGAIVLVGGLLQERSGRGALDLLGTEIGRRARAFQQAGCDTVDERLRRQRHSHAAREVDEASLRDSVRNGRAHWPEPGHRRDVDDAALAVRLHDGCHRLDEAHWPRQIDIHDFIPHPEGKIVEVREGDRLVVSGVVDEDVQTAKAYGHVADQSLHGRPIGYIAGERSGVDLMSRCQLPGHGLRLVAALCVDDGDMRPFLRQRVTNALPEPAVAAGHDGDRALKVHNALLRAGALLSRRAHTNRSAFTAAPALGKYAEQSLHTAPRK
jgi:hypothetical protein